MIVILFMKTMNIAMCPGGHVQNVKPTMLKTNTEGMLDGIRDQWQGQIALGGATV